MTALHLPLLLALSALLPTGPQASGDAAGRGAGAAQASGKMPSREELVRIADTDGDGVLSAEEREVMATRLKAFREAQQKKDKPALETPETLEAETDVVPQRELPARFRHFDRDGDGELSVTERILARQALTRLDRGSAAASPKDESKRSATPRQQAEVRERATSRPAPSASSTQNSESMELRKQAVARERARRSAIQSRLDQGVAISSSRGGRGAAGRGGDGGKKSARRSSNRTSLDAYRELRKLQPKIHQSKTNGWGGGNRQGIMRGKKRGSEYYRRRIQTSGRGGRGGGGARGVNNNRGF